MFYFIWWSLQLFQKITNIICWNCVVWKNNYLDYFTVICKLMLLFENQYFIPYYLTFLFLHYFVIWCSFLILFQLFETPLVDMWPGGPSNPRKRKEEADLESWTQQMLANKQESLRGKSSVPDSESDQQDYTAVLPGGSSIKADRSDKAETRQPLRSHQPAQWQP